MQRCGKVNGIVKSIATIIMRKLYSTIRKHLKPSVIPKDKIKEIIVDFKTLHEIPYILVAIDGSHVPIVEPKVDPKSCYFLKGFYFTLIQGIANAKCSFWDYDYGWARSIHDWVFFQKTYVKSHVIKDKLLPYKLIGNVTHPMHPWFYSPFKDEKDGLPKYIGILYNLIQGCQCKELLECQKVDSKFY